MNKQKWLLALCAALALIGTGSYAVTQASQAFDKDAWQSAESAANKRIQMEEEKMTGGETDEVDSVPGSYSVLKGQDPDLRFLQAGQQVLSGKKAVAVFGHDAYDLEQDRLDEQAVRAIAAVRNGGGEALSGVRLTGEQMSAALAEDKQRAQLVHRLSLISKQYGTDGLVLDVIGIDAKKAPHLQALVAELALSTDLTLSVPYWEYNQFLKKWAIPHNVTVLGVNSYDYLLPAGTVNRKF
ncbi:hypothetical protein OS242_07275 [Tumebacillus sp. DT12]|uniref:GH18 domain-containing protein n=1 Tax=Tumebacillus lacus TaxID=2995335 RepID=A0ABT3WYL8_9BACL|nr:hypothetical protein [Tumebacillus lacus]MCX7569762.1 hypothetical protein [Tumebacillus lacus]